MAEKPLRVPIKSPDGKKIKFVSDQAAVRRVANGWTKITERAAEKAATTPPKES